MHATAAECGNFDMTISRVPENKAVLWRADNQEGGEQWGEETWRKVREKLAKGGGILQ